jgi:apolipoprotein D and lipocalin family protein
MKRLLAPLLVLIGMTQAGCAGSKPAHPPVTGFELERYLGTWYEIARLPNWFEKGLTHVTATYSLRDDGKVKVVNKGYRDGEQKVAEGKAKFAGSPEIGYLRVSFFWIFYSDYIIVELDSEYRYALVVGSGTDLLWILSRTPELEQEIVERLLNRAGELGIDTDQVYFTPQEGKPGAE